MPRERRLAVALFVLMTASSASAWWGGGHDILSQAAVTALPDEMPAFFRAGARGVAHASYDPDISKNRDAPIVSAAEHGEHFLNLELLGEEHFPPIASLSSRSRRRRDRSTV